MKNTVITIFKNFASTNEPHYITLENALKRIKEGKSKDKIDEILSEKDEKIQKDKKKELPCVLFCGKFTYRNSQSCVKYSGIICLDFDNLGDEFENTFNQLKTKKYVLSVFRSPRGKGLKALVRVHQDITKHSEIILNLLNTFPNADKSGKDVSRICYECYDSDIYINYDAIEYVPIKQPTLPLQNNTKEIAKETLLTWASKMMSEAREGNKHYTLVKVSYSLGGYVAGGVLDRYEVESHLKIIVDSMQGVNDLKSAYKTISKCLTNGMQRPLTWTERGERSNVIERVPLEYYQKKLEVNVNPETNIITAGQLKEKMIAQFTHGKEYGSTTYFKDAISRGLDENFTFKRGELTGIVGIPNHGKSKFIEQLLLIKSVKEGLKFAFFSPESYPADEFFDSLIETLIGKSVDQRRTNVMTIEEYMYAIDFIDKHFFYVYPENEQSIQEIEANFQYLIEERGVSGFIIDPHNQVDHDKKLGERDDEFLSRYLKQRKRFATENQVYYFLVVHPPKVKKEGDKDYPAPDIYDLSGGAMWANKLDNIITIHRPFKTSDPRNSTVEVIVGKIKKQKLVGVPGTKVFEFNVKDSRYYLDGFNPLNDNTHIPIYLKVEQKTYEDLGYPSFWDEK